MFWIKQKFQESEAVKTIACRLISSAAPQKAENFIFMENGATHVPDFHEYKNDAIDFYRENIEDAKEKRIEVNLYISSNADAVQATAGLAILIDTVKTENDKKDNRKEIFFNYYCVVENDKTYKLTIGM